MWSDGYDLPQDEDALRKLAIGKDSAFIQAFGSLAAERLSHGDQPARRTAELDLDLLRAHRRSDVMGDKYRRPETYGILSDANVRGIEGETEG